MSTERERALEASIAKILGDALAGRAHQYVSEDGSRFVRWGAVEAALKETALAALRLQGTQIEGVVARIEYVPLSDDYYEHSRVAVTVRGPRLPINSGSSVTLVLPASPVPQEKP